MKKIAAVNFKGLNPTSPSSTKKYFYYTRMENLKEGDIVVVQSIDSLSLANFVGYVDDVDESRTPHKWIISLADVSLNKELAKIENQKKDLQEQIDQRYKQFKEIEKVRLLAAYDPKLASLLRQLDNLNDKEKEYDVEQEVKSIMVKTVF